MNEDETRAGSEVEECSPHKPLRKRQRLQSNATKTDTVTTRFELSRSYAFTYVNVDITKVTKTPFPVRQVEEKSQAVFNFKEIFLKGEYGDGGEYIWEIKTNFLF